MVNVTAPLLILYPKSAIERFFSSFWQSRTLSRQRKRDDEEDEDEEDDEDGEDLEEVTDDEH